MKGKIEIPNLSEEHEDMNDVDLDVSVSTKGFESDLLKEFMRKGAGAAQIRAQLNNYVTSLKTEYSTGLILPKKGDENGVKAPPAPRPTAAPGSATAEAEKGMRRVDLGSGGGGVKLELDTLRLEETMKCTGQELYNALTQRDMVQIFTGGPAKMAETAEKGGDFELLGGGISGKYIEVKHEPLTNHWPLRGL